MAHCGDTVEEEMEELAQADADGETEMAQADADGEKETPARRSPIRTRSGREVRPPARFFGLRTGLLRHSLGDENILTIMTYFE